MIELASLDSRLPDLIIWGISKGYFVFFSLIDIFQLHTPATSIAVSPTDELLATTHANDLGIYLWYNRALHVSQALSFSSIDGENKPEVVPLPETKCFQENGGEWLVWVFWKYCIFKWW